MSNALTLPKEPPTLATTCLADVEIEAREWFWPGYIPKHDLTMLQGSGGRAKSTIALTIAAIIAQGQAASWPHGVANTLPPHNILYLTREDSITKTIKGRFLLTGADPQLAVVASRVKIKGELIPLRLNNQSHLAAISDYINSTRDATGRDTFIIVDTINDFLGINHAGDKSTSIRDAMEILREFAEDNETAFLYTNHENKEKKDVTSASLGSGMLSASARSVMVAYYFPPHETLPEDERSFVLGVIKHNVVKKCRGIVYKTVEATVGFDAKGREVNDSFIEWGEEYNGSADEDYKKVKEGQSPQTQGHLSRTDKKNLILDAMEEGVEVEKWMLYEEADVPECGKELFRVLVGELKKNGLISTRQEGRMAFYTKSVFRNPLKGEQK